MPDLSSWSVQQVINRDRIGRKVKSNWQLIYSFKSISDLRIKVKAASLVKSMLPNSFLSAGINIAMDHPNAYVRSKVLEHIFDPEFGLDLRLNPLPCNFAPAHSMYCCYRNYFCIFFFFFFVGCFFFLFYESY